MRGPNEKAAEGQTRAALDTADRQANHTDRIEAAQHIRDVSKLCFQSASDEAKQMRALMGIEGHQKGALIWRTVRAWLIHGQIASRMGAR